MSRKTNAGPKPVVKIDRGVPVPEYTPRNTKYPLKDLEVGDSFLVPSRSACAGTAKRLGITVTVRNTPEGFRLWRVK